MSKIKSLINEAGLSFDRGYEAGYRDCQSEPKRYALQEIKEATGGRILDYDGHWDGEAICNIKTVAVANNHSKGVERIELTLAMDLDCVDILIEKLIEWKKSVEVEI